MSHTKSKTIMIDIDGVICTEEKTFERALATPIDGAREAVSALRKAGHTVVLYTGRGWPEFRATKAWLDQHGFEYDGIQMGKPIADFWIDDRAIRFTNWKDTLSQLPPLPQH